MRSRRGRVSIPAHKRVLDFISVASMPASVASEWPRCFPHFKIHVCPTVWILFLHRISFNFFAILESHLKQLHHSAYACECRATFLASFSHTRNWTRTIKLVPGAQKMEERMNKKCTSIEGRAFGSFNAWQMALWCFPGSERRSFDS